MSEKEVCEPIEHETIAPGWGCCRCRSYNGLQRVACKKCKHVRCDDIDPVEFEKATKRLEKLMGSIQ